MTVKQATTAPTVTPKKAGFLGVVKNFVTLALSGGLTALLDHLLGGMGPVVLVVVAGAWHSAFTYVQNYMEAKGLSPTFFDAIVKFVKTHLLSWAKS